MAITPVLAAFASRWTHWMCAMSWQVTLFAVLVGLVAVFGRRFSASFRHLLWLMVFIKLVTPPGLSTPWSPGNLLTQVPLNIEWRDRAIPSSEPTGQGEAPARFSPAANESEGSVVQQRRPLPVRVGIATILMALWLLGSTILLSIMFLQNRSYGKTVMRTSEPASGPLLELFEQCRKNMSIRLPVQLRISKVVTTPGVFGVWRPVILWPTAWETELEPEDVESILAHELAHVKRLDGLAAWFVAVLSCLYWFHPVVWLANLLLRREREMACDDIALHSMHQEPKQYVSAILRVAELFRGTVPMGAGFLGILELSDNLLYRVRSIGDEARPRKTGWGSALLLLGLLAAIPMAPGGALAQQAVPDRVASTPPSSVAAPTAPKEAVKEASDRAPVSPAPSNSPGTPTLALIEFTRAGSAADLADTAVQLSELSQELLANDPGLRMVDRALLAKTMAEVKLGESGMVDAATAMHIGKITGAQLLLSGRIMAVDTHWIVTARLVDTVTSELAAVKAEADTSEGIQVLAKRTASSIAERAKTFRAAVSTTESSPLDKKVEALRAGLAGRELPRLVVAIPETHIGRAVPDPAGENEIISVLTRAGFQVIDVSTFMKRPEAASWLDLFFGRAQGRDGHEVNIREGFRNPADILHDARLDRIKEKADILVAGEAFSERAGEMNGFVSCRARVEVKALDTASETVAAAMSQHAPAVDTAEFVAGKKALCTAGGELAVTLAQELADYWGAKRARATH